MITAESRLGRSETWGRVGLQIRHAFRPHWPRLISEETAPLQGDAVSLPQGETPTSIQKFYEYEPVSRKTYGSFIMRIKKNVDFGDLDKNSLFREIETLAWAKRLSDCTDGTVPFASVRFGGHAACVSITNDCKNGLVKIDFYEAPEALKINVSDKWMRNSKFELDCCVHRIAGFLHDCYGTDEKNITNPLDIIKFEYVDPEMEKAG